MVTAKDVLRPSEYNEYVNFQRWLILMMIVSGLMTFSCVAALFVPPDPNANVPPGVQRFRTIFFIIGAVIGYAGIIAGMVSYLGIRELIPLVYAVAAVYLFLFPVGTKIGLSLILDLRTYINHLERIKAAMADVLKPSEFIYYQIARMGSILFIATASFITLLSCFLLFMIASHSNVNIAPQEKLLTTKISIFAIVIGCAGIAAGVVGYLGIRELSPLVYAMAVVYLLLFPLGTIASSGLIIGLWNYIGYVEHIKRQQH